ncbi:SDR family NAD(P)-dependent oxidoreductase [Caldicellulosiruptoraceae bacterium PP1]
MFVWDNKVLLITGGTRGIGKAIVDELIKKNVKIIIAARSNDELLKIENEFIKNKDDILLVQADISQESDCKKVIELGYNNFKKIDILINNAGIGLRDKIEDINDSDLRKVFDINFYGSFYMIKYTIPYFKKQKGGTIVNICSLGVKRPVPNTGGYTLSKVSLAYLGDIIRIENSKDNIKVLNVFPGSVETSFRKNALGKEYPQNEKRLSRLSPSIVAKRIIKGIEKGQKEIYTSNADKIMAIFTRLFPSLSDYIILKSFKI